MNRILAAAAVSLPFAAVPLASQSILQQAYIKASNPDAHDQFGFSIAMSGNTAVVGAYREDSNAMGPGGNQANDSAADAGAAYVFVRSGSTWVQQAYLKPSNTAAGDAFGCDVAISGDTIVVGAYGEDSGATGVGGNQADDSADGAGAAYVFVRTGTTWAQQAYLKASNTNAEDLFGLSVAISGDTILVGAFNEDSGDAADEGDDSLFNAGAAYVFTRSGTTWSQQAYLKPTTLGWNDRFGWAVALSGDTAVVGSRNEDSNATGVNGDAVNDAAEDAGAAWVFVRSGTTWSQQAYLKASNTDAFDNFGAVVAIDEDTIAVGAPAEDSNAVGVGGDENDDTAISSGAVYVFARDGSSWTQQAYVKGDNTEAGDQIGVAVSVSGDTLIAGSRYEDSSATGVGGNGADNSLSWSGAAYVFQRCGDEWGQLAYLKASNTGSTDFFGDDVCVNGDTVLVSARTEDGGSPGVNGPNNDSATDAGATYVFDLGLELLDMAGTGCPGESAPICDGTPSGSAGFSISCPSMSLPCFGGGAPVLLFGRCSLPVLVLPPITCGACTLAIVPTWGSASSPMVVAPGLLAGFTFCVQCGCVADPGGPLCVNLSEARTIVVTL